MNIHLVNIYRYFFCISTRIAFIVGMCAYFIDLNKIVFHSECTNLHFHQQFKRVLPSPHLPNSLYQSFWWVFSGILTMVLICIFFMTKETDQTLVICLLEFSYTIS